MRIALGSSGVGTENADEMRRDRPGQGEQCRAPRRFWELPRRISRPNGPPELMRGENSGHMGRTYFDVTVRGVECD